MASPLVRGENVEGQERIVSALSQQIESLELDRAQHSSARETSSNREEGREGERGENESRDSDNSNDDDNS